MYVYMPCLLLLMGRRNVDVEARKRMLHPLELRATGVGADTQDQREGHGKSR